MDERLQAVCDLQVAAARELAGLHRYDGVVQDLSPDGVRAGLARLARPARVGTDAHDDRHLQAAEDELRVTFDDLADHRRNPLHLINALDLACYDRAYAPADERAAARRAQLAAWPDAIDTGLATLDAVPAALAGALLGAARGLISGVPESAPEAPAARVAHARLVDHLERAAHSGPREFAIGGARLARLLGAAEATPVDLGDLAARADAEHARLSELLEGALAQLAPGEAPRAVLARLLDDHPPVAAIPEIARGLMAEITAFTLAHDLIPDPGGVCLVEPAPPSRSWAMAMLVPNGPWEAESPSVYHVTPPDPTWDAAAAADWLAVFSPTTLPAITAHEVTPGHFAHVRLVRRVASPVRRTLFSAAFVEGWAHYGEELLVEEGFRSADPRYRIGVALEALLRVTRLRVALGVHTAAMDLAEATEAFVTDAYLRGPAAASEAARATFDYTYGRYTWGKLEIRAARERARSRLGARYSHRRFHEALLALGAPPLGLLDDAWGERAPEPPGG